MVFLPVIKLSSLVLNLSQTAAWALRAKQRPKEPFRTKKCMDITLDVEGIQREPLDCFGPRCI